MHGCYGVDRQDMGGGLALFWKVDIDLSIHSFSCGHIEMVITYSAKGPFWSCWIL